MDLAKSVVSKNNNKKNTDVEGQKAYEYLSSAALDQTVIVAFLDNNEGEPLYAVITGVLGKHKGRKVASFIGNTSYEIKTGDWGVYIDFLVVIHKRDIIYAYDAEHKSILIPCRRMFVLPHIQRLNLSSIESQFIQFKKSDKYKTGNITIQIEHFIIDSKSIELVIDSL